VSESLLIDQMIYFLNFVFDLGTLWTLYRADHSGNTFDHKATRFM